MYNSYERTDKKTNSGKLLYNTQLNYEELFKVSHARKRTVGIH